MTTSDAFLGALILVICIGCAGLALWCLFCAARGAYRYYRDNRPNRKRRGVIRAPDPRCVVGGDWKAHVQQHRF